MTCKIFHIIVLIGLGVQAHNDVVKFSGNLGFLCNLSGVEGPVGKYRKIWTKLGGQNGKLHRIHTLSLSVYTGEVKRRETKSQNWHVREREDDEEEDVTSNFPIFSSPSSFVISGRFQGPPGGFCFAVLREKRSALFFTDSPKSFEDKKRTKTKAKRWKNNRKTQKKQYILYIYVGFSEESPEKTLHSVCIVSFTFSSSVVSTVFVL